MIRNRLFSNHGLVLFRNLKHCIHNNETKTGQLWSCMVIYGHVEPLQLRSALATTGATIGFSKETDQGR